MPGYPLAIPSQSPQCWPTSVIDLTFFDLLYRIRGRYIRRIDMVLEPQAAELVQGKRKTRAVDFERMIISEMEGQPMDSDYFVTLCHILVDSTPEDVKGVV